MVTSDLPSLRDFFSEEEVLFVPPGNAKALAKTILSLFKDQITYDKWQKNTKKAAEKNLWSKRGKEMLDQIMEAKSS